MSDLNQCTFSGRLGADPEIRSDQQGRKIANFRIAVGKAWRDKQTGEKQERTQWVSVVVFSDGLTGIVEKYLKKGSRVIVCGEWQTRKWQDKSGADRFTTECVLQSFGGFLQMLDSRKDGDDNGKHTEMDYRSDKNAAASDIDDEIPF